MAGDNTRIGRSPLLPPLATELDNTVTTSITKVGKKPIAMGDGDTFIGRTGASGTQAVTVTDVLRPDSTSRSKSGAVRTPQNLTVPTQQHAVRKGESFEEALGRYYRAGGVTPALIELVAELNGVDPTQDPPSILALPDEEQIFFLLHPSEDASRPVFQCASFISTGPGDTWLDMAKKCTSSMEPPPTDKQLQGFALQIAALNGRSVWEPPTAVVALPDLSHADIAANEHLMAERARREGFTYNAPKRNYELLDRLGVRLDKPASEPTEGEAYRTGSYDTLRGVFLHAYAKTLKGKGLSESEAAEKAEKMMLAFLVINGLSTSEINNLNAPLYFPDADQLEATVAIWESEGRLSAPELAGLRDELAPLAQGLQADARLPRTRSEKVDELAALEGAVELLSFARLERANEAMHDLLAVSPTMATALALAQEFGQDPGPKAPGQMQAPLAGESKEAYVNRTAPTAVGARRAHLLELAEKIVVVYPALQKAGLIDAKGQLDMQRFDALSRGALKDLELPPALLTLVNSAFSLAMGYAFDEQTGAPKGLDAGTFLQAFSDLASPTQRDVASAPGTSELWVSACAHSADILRAKVPREERRNDIDAPLAVTGTSTKTKEDDGDGAIDDSKRQSQKLRAHVEQMSADVKAGIDAVKNKARTTLKVENTSELSRRDILHGKR